jgi:CBS-domain-containing membrane protein
MSTTVRDIMTDRVVAVREDAHFKEMAAVLRWSRISALPVLDSQDKVVGVVSEADMLAKVSDQGGQPGRLDELMHHREHQKAAAVTAGELMTSPAVTIGPDEAVQRAARLMYDRKVKRLPVVDPRGRLIGIVSRVDVLSVFSRPDDEIRREVTDDVLLGSFLVDPQALDVAVRDGIVTISGRPETDEIGREIITAVRHIEGVVAVRDRLSYTDNLRPAGAPAS